MDNYKKSTSKIWKHYFQKKKNLNLEIKWKESNFEIDFYLFAATDVAEPFHSFTFDQNALHMNVKIGSKVSNLLSYVENHFIKVNWAKNAI